jgi:hypothetical protein
MQRGRLQNLFLDKSKFLSEDKLPKAIGISSSNKLQPPRFRSVKQHNPEIRNKFMGFLHFGDIHDKKLDIHDLEDCALHPDNDTILS